MWRRFAIVAGLAMVVAAAASFVLMQDRYEAFALLRVASRPDTVFAHGAVPAEDFAVFKRTQALLLLSPQVLQRAVSEPEISKLPTIHRQSDPANWLHDRLRVEYPDDAEVMRVTLTGSKPNELKAILNAVVKKYMSEIVYHDTQRKREQESRLSRTYEEYTRDLERQMGALHTMEKVAKVSSSESASVAKKIASERLQDAFVHRRDVLRQLREAELKIALEKAREEHGVKTAEADQQSASQLWLLEKETTYLQGELAKADDEIRGEADAVASLESFSASVVAKQDELRRLKDVVNNLGTDLERLRLERLSLERITKISDAVVESGNGRLAGRYAGLGLLALGGVVLMAVGMRRKPAAAA